MSNFFKQICLGVAIVFPFFVTAGNQEQMLGDLDNIKNAFKISYAPAEWKSVYSNWDIDTEIAIAKENVMSNNVTIKDFQKIVKKFLVSTNDYHVNVVFHSTEKASLPFRVKSANGRYFISFINRKLLSRESFPFSEGDELVLFDGRPVNDVVNELMSHEISSNEQTDRALAEVYLTHRSGKMGQVVPKGSVIVSILPNGSSKMLSHQLIWDYKPEKIAPPPKSNSQAMQMAISRSLRQPVVAASKNVLKDPIFHKLLAVPYFNHLIDEDDEEDIDDADKATDFIGSRNGFIPALGSIWWKTSSESPFKAYVFEAKDRKLVGYIRIGTYMPTSDGEYNSEEALEEFGKLISFMESRTEALVIDQVDNPGGSLFYLYSLAAMLTDQPLTTPKHRMAITQADVYTASKNIPLFESITSDSGAKAKLGETFEGIPMTHQFSQFILNYFRFIVEEWNAGRRFTNPSFLYGVDYINPNLDVNYSKPILVLVNNLDFSGGDFFPAILQDNGRATIMGTRTAGAGGFITRLKFPNLSGIAEVRFTGSIAERKDGSPIENLGVTPDLPYELTINDLRFNYEDYVDAIRDAVETLINEKG